MYIELTKASKIETFSRINYKVVGSKMNLLTQGGLGNQLFILNFAHQLATDSRSKVRIIHRKPLPIKNHQEFELSNILNFCKHRITSEVSDWPFDMFNFLDKWRVFRTADTKEMESRFLFANVANPFLVPKVIKKNSKFIRGYFQSGESVLANIQNFKSELEEAITKIVSDFGKAESLGRYQAIHIRRGDFVQNKETLGLIHLRYYLKNLHTSLPIKIVTDSNLNFVEKIRAVFPDAAIYGPESLKTWDAFNLLTKAQHLQIANSTFSWWAGTLAKLNGSQVYAPDPWNQIPQIGNEGMKNPNFIYTKAEFE